MQNRLSGSGSMIYQIGWKQHVTPLGRAISRQRASARRTSDNEPFSGLSGWATVMANEARAGYQNRRNGKKGTQKSLTTQAVDFLDPERGDPGIGWKNGPARLTASGQRADWLSCRDGSWRPVEPGTFPLADGIPARVGLLRGYGNAINPRAAKVFIEAFTAATVET